MTQTKSILRLDGSIRSDESVTRKLTDDIVARFDGADVISRDSLHELPLINEAWVGANFTPAEQRSPEQKELLALSDRLIEELRAADTLVLGLPVYNFSVPAGFKAWIDLIARAGVTFHYTENGPEGLLKDKRAIVAMAAGGTQLDSDIDFAGRYVRHLLGFIGITNVEFVRADRLAIDAEGSLAEAHKAVEELAA